MTAAQLAALLLTYGDLPVSVQAVITWEGNEYNVTTAAEGLHCEVTTDPAGTRSVAVTAYTPMEV